LQCVADCVHAVAVSQASCKEHRHATQRLAMGACCVMCVVCEYNVSRIRVRRCCVRRVSSAHVRAKSPLSRCVCGRAVLCVLVYYCACMLCSFHATRAQVVPGAAGTMSFSAPVAVAASGSNAPGAGGTLALSTPAAASSSALGRGSGTGAPSAATATSGTPKGTATVGTSAAANTTGTAVTSSASSSRAGDKVVQMTVRKVRRV
jgi:hypothetical protein